MVRACHVVAQRHRRVGAHEDGACVLDALGDRTRVSSVDFEVLRGIRVSDLDAGLEVVDEDDAGLLATQGLLGALGVRGDLIAGRHLGLDGIGKLLRIRDEDARRHGIMLGLRDEVVGYEDRVSRLIGEDSDLGRASFRVGANDAAHETLSRSDKDIAGTRNNVDGLKGFLPRRVIVAVGKKGDGLAATDGPHLIDAEDVAGGQHRGVRQTAKVLLRRRRHDERRGASFLGRNRIHDHGGRVDRLAARDVETHALDGREDLRDGGARRELRGVVLRLLLRVDLAHAGNGFLNGGADLRIQLCGSLGEFFRGHAHRSGAYAVEFLAKVERRGGAAVAHCVDQGLDLVEDGGNIRAAAGQGAAHSRSGHGGSAHVGDLKHETSSHILRPWEAPATSECDFM